MKTGFICASGFNLVSTVTRGDRRLIGIVLGAPNSAVRTDKVLGLFERGFNGSGNALSWLTPSLGTVDALQPVNMPPPDLHEEVCGKNRNRGEVAEEEPPPTADPDRNVGLSAVLPFGSGGGKPAIPVLGPPVPSMAPIVVFVGPPKKPGNPEAAVAKSEPRHKPKAAKHALAAAKSTTPAATAPPPAHRKKSAPAASAEKPASAPTGR